MQFFVGLDVSLDSSSICVIDECGVIIKEGKADSDPIAIARFIRHRGRKIEHVGLETGSLSQWLYAGLTREGFRVTVMEARHVRAAFAAMRVKTDRNDARGIAQLIRLGWFKAVHVKAPTAQETRALLNGRQFVVDKLTGIENSMRAALRNFGLKMGQVSRRKWAKEALLPLRTAQRWVSRYRRYGLIGLIRAGRADQGKRRRVPDDVRCFAEGLALERPPLGPSAIYREVCLIARARGEQVPGYHTIYNVIRAIPDDLKTLALDGEKAYREAYDLVHRREAERPNQIWQADHTQLDLWVRRAGGEAARPWLTVIIDDYSRAIAGFFISFDSPSAACTALERVLVATGRYLGEGFDDARLDTLFLTMPISWRGTLSQYAGRLHRRHASKHDVVIYDYVDENEPMLMKMATRREAGYRSLGYRPVRSVELALAQPSRERT